MSTTTTKDQIQDRLADALVEFGAERDQIHRDAGWEELDIDSLDLVELAQIVEDDYGVQMKEEQLAKIETVGQAVDFVAERADQ
jgi:acyl carrier protein